MRQPCIIPSVEITVGGRRQNLSHVQAIAILVDDEGLYTDISRTENTCAESKSVEGDGISPNVFLVFYRDASPAICLNRVSMIERHTESDWSLKPNIQCFIRKEQRCRNGE